MTYSVSFPEWLRLSKSFATETTLRVAFESSLSLPWRLTVKNRNGNVCYRAFTGDNIERQQKILKATRYGPEIVIVTGAELDDFLSFIGEPNRSFADFLRKDPADSDVRVLLVNENLLFTSDYAMIMDLEEADIEGGIVSRSRARQLLRDIGNVVAISWFLKCPIDLHVFFNPANATANVFALISPPKPNFALDYETIFSTEFAAITFPANTFLKEYFDSKLPLLSDSQRSQIRFGSIEALLPLYRSDAFKNLSPTSVSEWTSRLESYPVTRRLREASERAPINVLVVQSYSSSNCISMIEDEIKMVGKIPDLIVLPEHILKKPWTTGSAISAHAELSRLSDIAKKVGCHIVCGSIDELDASSRKLYNSAVVLNDYGDLLGVYRKQHPFNLKYSEGSKEAIFDTKWGRFGVLICFDVERPASLKQTLDHKPDLLINPTFIPSSSSGTQARSAELHWRTALDLMRSQFERILGELEHECVMIRCDTASPEASGTSQLIRATSSQTSFSSQSHCIWWNVKLGPREEFYGYHLPDQDRSRVTDKRGHRVIQRCLALDPLPVVVPVLLGGLVALGHDIVDSMTAVKKSLPENSNLLSWIRSTSQLSDRFVASATKGQVSDPIFGLSFSENGNAIAVSFINEAHFEFNVDGKFVGGWQPDPDSLTPSFIILFESGKIHSLRLNELGFTLNECKLDSADSLSLIEHASFSSTKTTCLIACQRASAIEIVSFDLSAMSSHVVASSRAKFEATAIISTSESVAKVVSIDSMGTLSLFVVDTKANSMVLERSSSILASVCDTNSLSSRIHSIRDRAILLFDSKRAILVRLSPNLGFHLHYVFHACDHESFHDQIRSSCGCQYSFAIDADGNTLVATSVMKQCRIDSTLLKVWRFEEDMKPISLFTLLDDGTKR